MAKLQQEPKRTLIIGDLHCPFEHPDYLEFCKQVQKRFKTNHTIFIGDGIDNHASSYHESDPNGYSAGHELTEAIKRLGKWHKAFPGADYIMGNHCRLVARKAYTYGIATPWLRTFREVLQVPTWNFHTKLILDDVLYIHGEGVTARTKLQRAGRSVVQGHRHTEGYVWYHPTARGTLFGMQVGTGIDEDSYAFAYAKDHPAPVLSCGVVLGGIEAYIIPMIQ